MRLLDEKEQGIIAYITGEMTQKEKYLFEEKMKKDKNLEDEVSSLQTVQSQLGEWVDRDVPIPKIQLPDLGEGQRTGRWSLPVWMRIAASLFILFMFFWVTDLQITKSENALTISFGPVMEADIMEGAVVRRLVQEEINTYAENWNQQLMMLKATNLKTGALDRRELIKMLANQDLKLDQLNQQLENNYPVQMDKIYDTLTYMNEEQKKDISEMLGSLLGYWETRWENDLVKIENAFQRINHKMTVQRLENEQWLGNLLTDNNF